MTELIIVMGVSGVGKTTIAQSLATELKLPFVEGDDFHPATNVDKMAGGEALTDADRWPWLASLADFINQQSGAVVTCSALKRSYREYLQKHISRKISWVHLTLPDAEILKRMEQRADHFMPTSLLESQLAALEAPSYEDAFTLTNNKHPEEIVQQITQALPSEFGIIGLGVMGKSLARNFAGQGVRLALFNSHRPPNEVNIAKTFRQQFGELKLAKAFDDLTSFVDSLATPRKILLMVKAGEVVDFFVDQLKPLLEKGDIIIDAGNSHYKDTERRIADCKLVNINFLGMGVSGGEKGALEGPSMMPAGAKAAYEQVQPFLEKIAAKDKNGKPCCSYLGSGGAGHFIKMVHNGIEYGEMQLLAELGSYLQGQLQMQPSEIAKILQGWNEGPLQSYLLEITGKIYQHEEAGELLLNKILDKAGNKGTGNWTTVAASELGIAIPGLTAALFARYISAQKSERVALQKLYGETTNEGKGDLTIDELKVAYQCARLMNHRQGFALLSAASAEYDWSLSLAEIARVWSNGCILRSALIHELSSDLKAQTDLFANTKYISYLSSGRQDFAKVMQTFIGCGHPSPCWQANFQYFLNITEANSSANIIQAQRDFFGAHQYQRKDDSSESFYHTIWE